MFSFFACLYDTIYSEAVTPRSTCTTFQGTRRA